MTNSKPSCAAARRAVAFGCLIVAGIFNSNAIELSESGLGQVHVLPLFTTRSGNETLLTVSHADPYFDMSDKAMRLRLLDGDGALLASFNVYVPRNGAWAASLSSAGEGSRLSVTDDACTLAIVEGTVERVESIDIAAREGYVEIIEMGITGRSCEFMAERWNDGTWGRQNNRYIGPPTGKVRATGAVINGERGTMFDVPITSLAAFSDIPQHFRPGSAQPNLGSAHDAGTESGKTGTRICHRGECVSDTWADPLDAVSAVLMNPYWAGEFEIDPAIGAATEWVFTLPTLPLFQEPLEQEEATLIYLPRAGGEHEFICTGFPPPCRPHQPVGPIAPQFMVFFNDANEEGGSPMVSPILGIPHEAGLDDIQGTDLPPRGVAWLSRADAVVLESNSGRTHVGLPAAGMMILQYENGTLTANDGSVQRANYATARPLSRNTSIVEMQLN